MSTESTHDDAVLDTIAGALNHTLEVNGGELESILTIYRPKGVAVFIVNALHNAGFEVVER